MDKGQRLVELMRAWSRMKKDHWNKEVEKEQKNGNSADYEKARWGAANEVDELFNQSLDQILRTLEADTAEFLRTGGYPTEAVA